MTNEELYLRNKVGQGNPFKVPEGYFEQLTSQVMNQLPEKKGRWLYAAACVAAIAVLGLTFMFNNRQAVEQQSLTASVSAVERDYMDEAADYALIDNAEIYACLSEN